MDVAFNYFTMQIFGELKFITTGKCRLFQAACHQWQFGN